jgi:oligopeptide transport system substrate-binding protein
MSASTASRIFLALLLTALGALSAAATVPSGTQLAKQQVLNRGNGNEPETLDPARARSDAALQLARDLYAGLTGESPAGEVVPAVADRWHVSDDGTEYTFHIRANARWSNGKPLTAGDFVYAWRRAVDPKTGSPYADTFAVIANGPAIVGGKADPATLGVSAPDAHTLKVKLHAPAPYFLDMLTEPVMFPVYRPAIKKYGDAFTRPGHSVTNGAYELADWVVNSKITLTRNPYYWDNAHTVIDTVNYLPITDEASELDRYRAGGLDVTYTIPEAQLGWIRSHLGSELHIAPYLSTYFYGFNSSLPPFKDNPKLRQALSMAIDRSVIATKILHAGEQPAYGFVPPGMSNYKTQRFAWAGWPRDKRLARARTLYREAGYSKEKPLQVTIMYNTGDVHQRIAQAIAAMWKANLGVDAQLVNEEFKVFLQDRQEMRTTQIFRSGWVADYNDAYSFLQILLGDNGINDTGYNSAEYDRLMHEASRQQDSAKREALLERAERVMLADNPIMPIYFYVSKHLVKPYVGGWHDNGLDHHYTKDLYIRAH